MQQQELSFAQQAREIGIEVALDHAEHIYPSWTKKAVGYVALHAVVHPSFFCSDVRLMAEADGLLPPPDERAWGGVMRIAKRRRLCVVETVVMSEGAYKTRWRSLIRQHPTCAAVNDVF